MNSPAREQALKLCANFTTSDWLKNAIQSLYQRDPVDALMDAEILRELMERRWDELMHINQQNQKKTIL
jgi:hypothetical protein